MHLVLELVGVVQLQAVLHRDLVSVWDVGFRVSGQGFRVQDLVFTGFWQRVQGPAFGFQGSGFMLDLGLKKSKETWCFTPMRL